MSDHVVNGRRGPYRPCRRPDWEVDAGELAGAGHRGRRRGLFRRAALGGATGKGDRPARRYEPELGADGGRTGARVLPELRGRLPTLLPGASARGQPTRVEEHTSELQ